MLSRISAKRPQRAASTPGMGAHVPSESVPECIGNTHADICTLARDLALRSLPKLASAQP